MKYHACSRNTREKDLCLLLILLLVATFCKTLNLAHVYIVDPVKYLSTCLTASM